MVSRNSRIPRTSAMCEGFLSDRADRVSLLRIVRVGFPFGSFLMHFAMENGLGGDPA
jgi:hypothetical protein